ncbi:MAG: hypothetical protein US86_C0004G0021 [Candidatus Daviesbacteria bacterium GW2011_GWA2_38_24]|uniref:UPF0102 protein US86_C0004G0021 n=1 Tax=Candidatus Daviesbacteria bacterium GW2011_GWA2_38_24 TaxID=1618422 RepID=A0A0G0JG95_9BACT|nr:MAG: hypothetical protein US86_C0004G0021 [Candidatus Daviesbacteria bacterium GW2011_GWA2_38_24]OGE23467.1 MAG: hypothetical protein A2688_00100 [Candidatus Daviesbacteria bacterium RIFCSPHIGHO2_01_FULL_38_8]
MTFNRKEIGRLAEDLAAEALLKKGYLILERNFSNRYGEIDIIAKDKETLVFVEVKAKKGIEFGLPEEMVNKQKIKKVQKMGIIYMKGQNLPCRIDVVAIVLSQDYSVLRLDHYENVVF